MKVPVNPLLSPSEGLFISSSFEGGGGGYLRGGLLQFRNDDGRREPAPDDGISC